MLVIPIEEIEKVTCPVCKAGPGESCKDERTGTPGRGWWHSKRETTYFKTGPVEETPR